MTGPVEAISRAIARVMDDGEAGYAVIDGLRLPMTRISLEGGQALFHCRKPGPLQPRAAGSPVLVTIFGEDGIAVCRGYTGASWAEVPDGSVLEFTVRMSMNDCKGDAEVPDGQGS